MTGHPLLLSNQQFLFWFVISSIVIPQGLINQRAPSDEVSPKPRMLFFLLAAMLVGAYTYDFWGMTRKQQYEYGFYSYELWDGKKVRWTRKKAVLQTITKGKVMEFDVHAFPYNIGPKGLNFRLLINDKLWDEINFFNKETRNLKYYLSKKEDEPVKIEIILNKSFMPIRLGLNRDGRDLGVALSEIKFTDEIPKDGIGFHEIETWDGPIPEWPRNRPRHIRWTGLMASMNIKGLKDGVTLFLMAAHPDAGKNPVLLEIQSEGKKMKEVVFADNQWKTIRLDQEAFGNAQVLTFRVSRTWNPKLLGLSEDNRDLGVAVAFFDNF